MASVLATANVFVAGTAFIDTVPKWVAGLAALVVASITVGWGVYVNGAVTPFAAVAARVLPSGELVAGPAAPGIIQEHDAVDVTKAAPPPVV
jgi:hypothetical protein